VLGAIAAAVIAFDIAAIVESDEKKLNGCLLGGCS